MDDHRRGERGTIRQVGSSERVVREAATYPDDDGESCFFDGGVWLIWSDVEHAWVGVREDEVDGCNRS